MKNILIPTDFTIKSLKLIHAAIARFEGDELQIHLVHALEADDSISGLLFQRKRLQIHSLYDDRFLQACEMLKNKHASAIKQIRIEFYLGSSRRYRNNFLAARQIDAIMLPTDYQFKACNSAHSIDPFSLWAKTNINLIHAPIAGQQEDSKVMDHAIAELLLV